MGARRPKGLWYVTSLSGPSRPRLWMCDLVKLSAATNYKDNFDFLVNTVGLNSAWTSLPVVALLAVSAVLYALFLAIERKPAEPILRTSVGN